MNSHLVLVSEQASVVQAAKLMAEEHVGSLLVEDGKKKIYAIVTDEDLVRKALATEKMSQKVKDIMSKPLICVDAKSDLTAAAKLMGEKHVKRLAVTQEGKVVGIITSRDISELSPSLYDLIAKHSG